MLEDGFIHGPEKIRQIPAGLRAWQKEVAPFPRLYDNVNLHNAVVTGDALHCEKENMQLVVENGGDFFFQLKGNQPLALAGAQRVVAGGSPLLPATPKRGVTAG